MGFILRTGISYCEVADRLMFLDIEADRYFCLSRQAEIGFRAIALGPLVPQAAARSISTLVQSGILVATDQKVGPLPCSAPARPVESLLDSCEVSANLWLRAAALQDLALAHLALRRRPLNYVLRGLMARKSHANIRSDRAQKTAHDIATAFDWSSRMIRSHNRCLPHSLAIARRLLSMGIPAHLVIGVSLNPFAAHSWVQSGQSLVNDRLDGVRHFTPILVI